MGGQRKTKAYKTNNNNNNESSSSSSSCFNAIPSGVKKMVKNIREIVGNDCTDFEIYEILRDCNMDPNDAVQRLLSQDSFHEVKSKRERRKEMKEKLELKSEDSDNGNCGVKVGTGYGIEISYVKEDMSTAWSITSSTSLMSSVRTMNKQPSTHSDHLNGDISSQTAGAVPTFPYEQAFQGSQVALAGVPGHVSMADVVRMGRLHTRGSQVAAETSHTSQDKDIQDSVHCHVKLSLDTSPSLRQADHDLQHPHSTGVSNTNHKSGTTMSQQNFENEWPVIKQQTSVSGILNNSTSDIGLLPHQSHLFSDGAKFSNNCQSKEVPVSERKTVTRNLGSNHNESDSISREQEDTNGYGGVLPSNNNSFKDMISYDTQSYMSELHEGRENGSHVSFTNGSEPLDNEISSTVASLLQLNLEEEMKTVPILDDNSGVVFPSYMQALAADCSHLSFGTYKSSVPTAISLPLVSNPLKSNLKDSAVTNDLSSAHLGIRNSVYLGDYTHSKQLIQQSTSNIWQHDLPVSSQLELAPDIHEVSSGLDYSSPKFVSNSSFKSIHESSIPFPSGIGPNTSSLTLDLMQQADPTPVLDELLSPPAGQSARDSVGRFSPFTGMNSKNSIPGDGSTIPMKKMLNSSASFLPKHSLIPSGASLAAGHALPQYLPTYSTSSDLTGCAAVTKPYVHTPSFMQANQDSTLFHHPQTGMKYSHQQLKGVPSMRSLPLSNANTSEYGSFWNPPNISRSFLNGSSITSNVSTVGDDNFLYAQYGRNSITTIQQNDSPFSRDYEPGLRTLPTVPDSRYYNLQGQGQPFSMLQQGRPHSAYQHSQSNYSFQQGYLPENCGAPRFKNVN